MVIQGKGECKMRKGPGVLVLHWIFLVLIIVNELRSACTSMWMSGVGLSWPRLRLVP